MTDATDSSSALMLTATGIARSFGRTRALVDADLELRRGEVHGLLGANGAGKSTLSRVICGLIKPDAGAITYLGQPLRLQSTREALRAGIALVSQETSLAPDMQVIENIFLPELGRPGRLSYARMRRKAGEILQRLGHEHALPLDEEVRRLSAAQRQLVEIAKALALDANLLIFDEPTASLSPTEVERLFDIMARLREDGRGLIFVSHRLEEVFAITDRVTIMREGRTVARSLPTAGLGQSDIIRHMVGQDIGMVYARRASVETGREEPVVLEIEKLAARPAVRDVSFSVRRGEIVGLGGLVGAGRSETAEAIFGLRPRTGGTIRVDGALIDPRKPADAVRAGIGMVAEDRRYQSIVPDLTVRENLLLAHIGADKGFGLRYGRRQRQLETLIAKLDLPADRLDASLLTFSGGMQQKVVIARWLLLEPKVLILDEPTKGVDIGTRTSIYAILREIAAGGVAVLVISSDFEELLGLCSRIVVISDGASIADLPAALLDEEKLTLLAAPRTSTARNTEFLRALTGEHGGTGFWALLEKNEIICLSSAASAGGVDIGVRPGEASRIDATQIPLALSRREPFFVPEADNRRSTILVPVRSRRGHDLGWVGLTLPGTSNLPPPAAIQAKVATLGASD
ncbi:sugar ABC transporter ATP-binding protein [Labrys monachus]|uniref:Ribose transport system ATP-binding protein/rhamnose transport system ATP-binding protein n=1 Tax=Labrys monachus TaxID=217067 RepID=A0ABU0FIQ1_9HYPH|nr:sugar ABC transporter ATP-binding protein [Labrys monachus]MDQ0393945.1 ribose transport system ATP-binding protein/rhamnose transport system ATP-binding protein [Labrys monachus]